MTSEPRIAVCIPSIPPRHSMLQRAVGSVRLQTMPAAQIAVVVDAGREGAAMTRQRALERVESSMQWVAFLDDDDEFKPGHLAALYSHAMATEADYVYSWYDVVDFAGRPQPHWDPRATEFGLPWDNAAPRQTTIVTLVRAELARAAGFVYADTTPAALRTPGRQFGAEDWLFTLECLRLGAKISHLPERTWRWYHHGLNTSGLPTRW